MKIKMHYATGKRDVACGTKNVYLTSNFREITCKRCLKTVAHKKVKANADQTPVH